MAEKKGGWVWILVGCGSVLLLMVCAGGAVSYSAYTDYLEKSKMSEATSNLRSLFTGATSYYAQEQANRMVITQAGLGLQTNCTVGPAITSNQPSENKQVLAGPLGPEFDALGFVIYDPVYYQYEIGAPPGSCGGAANRPVGTVYTFRAHGDLDGNGVTSQVELGVGTNDYNEMHRAPGFTFVDEDGARSIEDGY